MRRNLALRIGTLILVVFTTAAPAFAAPTDDSPVGKATRMIERVVRQIKRIVVPTTDIGLPKG